MISTFSSGRASFASPQARAGAWPSGTQASQTAFISAKSAMSDSQMIACNIRSRDDPKQTMGTLSGGNQQKVLLSRWLERESKSLVLIEPTRGVDVGAKVEIHRLVKQLAANGAAVLVVSSDLPELLELSDVIHVVRDGRIVGTLSGTEADEQSVMSLASGEASGSAA